jgi:pyrroline-5-carboxylate reductase
MVTSPAGTTAEGLKVCEEKNLKDIIISVIEAATRRSKELGKVS